MSAQNDMDRSSIIFYSQHLSQCTYGIFLFTNKYNLGKGVNINNGAGTLGLSFNNPS